MSAIAVVDIDGVLADVRHRVHFVEGPRRDWDGFFAAAVDDPPLTEGLAAVSQAVADGLGIVYLTGRPERCRDATAGWLAQHGFPEGPLRMRPDVDRRPARVFKVESLRELSSQVAVDRVIDDDIAVVRAIREAGYSVIHATWMDAATDGVDQILLKVQEGEGRT